MNKIYQIITALFIMLLPFANSVVAQAPEDCEDGRYTLGIEHLFEIETFDEIYGTNIDAANDSIDLYMTIYSPANDAVEERPVVILAFGGSFIAGERGDMAAICELLAYQGIIAVTIDYRLYPLAKLGFPTVNGFYDTAIKAVGDVKAAIRHIRLLADNGNPYGMDTDRIMVGGLSAGAIAALHAAALSEDDDIDEMLAALITQNGGIDGNTGSEANRSYSSDVLGVINLSGALLDTTLLNANDNIRINSMHGNADGTVPFGTGNALGLIPMHGSSIVHQRALNVGLESKLYVVEGGGHTDIYTEENYEAARVGFFMDLSETFIELFCDGAVGTVHPISQDMEVYPNPASSVIKWDKSALSGYAQVGVYNQNGQLVLNAQTNGENSLDISDLEAGVYYMLIKPLDTMDNHRIMQAKFVKVR